MHNETTVAFPTDYQSVLSRIDQIDPIEYGRSRNFIKGAVTYLSPYISRGVISVKQVRDAILDKGYAPDSIIKFSQELAWREYFQRVWQVKGQSLFEDLKNVQDDVEHKQMVQAIVQAQTGIIAVDKNIHQLYTTGYMHNHMRMYVASIACNIGKAHWLAPSRWMYYHLLDGDLASNTCSWQWVAGTFSSKKYYCTQENINRYTDTNQSNTFLEMDRELLEREAIPDSLKTTVDLELNTILPAVSPISINPNKPTLIYNSYNVDPRWRENEDVNRVLLLEPSHFKKFPVSNKVIEFIVGLSNNVKGCQIMVGEISELAGRYGDINSANNLLISKEHPAFDYYPGIRDQRDWMYPEVTGYFNSFFSFWKKCTK